MKEKSKVDLLFAIDQADTALGVSGLDPDNIFRKELSQAREEVVQLFAEREQLLQALADALMDLPPMIAAADRGEKWVVTAATRDRLERIQSALTSAQGGQA